MKRRHIKYLLIPLYIFFFSRPVTAQDISDSTSLSPSFFQGRNLTIGLDKQLNTYLFTNFLKYGLNSDKLFFGLRENFNSTITNAAQKNIKDEHNLFAAGGYKIASWLSAGLSLNNLLFSDDRYGGINKTALLSSRMFVQYNPLPNISITPFGGISDNRQMNETDRGMVYGADAAINSLMISDFELNSQMRFENEDISPRKNLLRNAGVNLTNRFENSFINTFSASYSEQRKDFYFAADPATALQFGITNNIQSRTETSYFLQDRFRSAPVAHGFMFDAAGSIYLRTVDRNTRYITPGDASSSNYDTRINELKSDIGGGVDYKSNTLFSSLHLSYSQYEEKHEAKEMDGVDYLVFSDRQSLEFMKNNQAETYTLSFITTWQLSASDNLTMSFFHRKLKYDTPSSDNFDDRDELLSIGSIGYERKLSSLFKLNFNLEGSLNKIVYIFSERSSNNSVRRFIKFSTSGLFSNNTLTSLNSAEVSANYTSFDYEYLNPSLQSYSFRQFILRDSSVYSLNRRIKIALQGYIKLSEQGNFQWSSFTERPARFLDERLFEPKIGYYSDGLILNWGFRYFNLSIFNINAQNEKIKASGYISQGPTTEIKYKAGDRIDLNFYGWYEFVTGDNYKREIPNIIFKMSWNI